VSALPWIKVCTDLPDHPKAERLGDAVGSPMAWAHLVALWAWCARFAQSGRVEDSAVDRRVERAARWKGKPGRFFEACVATGWIGREGENVAIVLGWDEYQGAHLAKLERDREHASRAYEAKKKPRVSRETSASVATTSGENRALEERRGDLDPPYPPSSDATQVAPTNEAPPSAGAGGTSSERTKEPDPPRAAEEHFLETFRKLFNAADARLGTKERHAYRRLYKLHGPEKLLACLERVAQDAWAREHWTLRQCVSDALLDRGSRPPPAAPEHRPKPDPESRPRQPLVEDLPQLPDAISPEKAKANLAAIKAMLGNVGFRPMPDDKPAEDLEARRRLLREQARQMEASGG
jgi:hypothetical protein